MSKYVRKNVTIEVLYLWRKRRDGRMAKVSNKQGSCRARFCPFEGSEGWERVSFRPSNRHCFSSPILYRFFSTLSSTVNPLLWKKGATSRNERKIPFVLPNSIPGLSVINKSLRRHASLEYDRWSRKLRAEEKSISTVPPRIRLRIRRISCRERILDWSRFIFAVLS